MTYKRLCVKKNIVIDFLLVFPFFAVQSLTLLGKNYSIFESIYNVLAVYRIMISAVTIICFIFKGYSLNFLSKGILIVELITFTACWRNESLTFQFAITQCISLVGFALLCQILDSEHSDDFLSANIYFWGVLCFLGVLSTYIFPYGFNHASITNDAIYFLGSKNAAYFYYAQYLFLRIYDRLSKNKPITSSIIILNIIFISSTMICRSANGTLMLVIILISLLAIKYKSIFRKLLKPANVIMVSILMAMAIPLMTSGKLDFFFNLIGRESNFSARTYIWESAIEMIKEKPLFGNGKDGDLVFFGRQTQAHNFYLDVAAKYGLVVIALIIFLVIVIGIYMKKGTNKECVFAGSLFMLTMLVHSLFDVTPMTYFILIMFFCYKIGSINKQEIHVKPVG